MQAKIKFAVSLVAFAVGAVLSVIPYFTIGHFELLIPGIVLIAVSTPFMYYFYAKIRSKHTGQSDIDILHQAEIESRISKEGRNAKK